MLGLVLLNEPFAADFRGQREKEKSLFSETLFKNGILNIFIPYRA